METLLCEVKLFECEPWEKGVGMWRSESDRGEISKVVTFSNFKKQELAQFAAVAACFENLEGISVITAHEKVLWP